MTFLGGLLLIIVFIILGIAGIISMNWDTIIFVLMALGSVVLVVCILGLIIVSLVEIIEKFR